MHERVRNGMGVKTGLRIAALFMLAAIIALCLACAGCSLANKKAAFAPNGANQQVASPLEHVSLADIAPYSGAPSVELNGNVPYFTDDELTLEAREDYSSLDSKRRCGPALSLVSQETMPKVGRGSIGMIKPSGWQVAKYDWIDGKYLYNRCHLIAYALTGENDNPRNLITGTRSMNVSGMLPYEIRVAQYVERSGNHVLYRATPVFEGDNLVASGVILEAQSIEDGGFGVRFCVWCYNVEPGVVIDYANGNNRAGDPLHETYAGVAIAPEGGAAVAPKSLKPGSEAQGQPQAEQPQAEQQKVFTYILNKNTHRFHYPDCHSVSQMKDKNKEEFVGTREEAINKGYQPCGNCHP